jgi:hypothetical protein
MTDIVERLRDKWKHSEEGCYEAADEILRLRKALSLIAENEDQFSMAWAAWIARVALSKQEKSID